MSTEVDALQEARLTEYVHETDRPLSASEIDSYHLSGWLINRIERARAAQGLAPEHFRILDFGCGRGQTVARLRLLGYQAFGLEVHGKWLDFARPGFEEVGLNPGEMLYLTPEGGQAPFDRGFFHFIYSLSVMEHVACLEPVAGEIARLMASGSFGFHQFQADRTILEYHLMMPFVHWLPKTKIRLQFIRLCLYLGINPKRRWVGSRTRGEQAQAYYTFSVEQTFYRKPSDYLAAFRRAGVCAKLETLDHPRLSSGSFKIMRALPLLEQALEVAVTRFWTVSLGLRRP